MNNEIPVIELAEIVEHINAEGLVVGGMEEGTLADILALLGEHGYKVEKA